VNRRSSLCFGVATSNSVGVHHREQIGKATKVRQVQGEYVTDAVNMHRRR
jgi:hypothetical protein